MRPVLKPALRRVWRDPTTLQLGLDPARAVLLRGVDGPVTVALGLLDGSRERHEVVDEAERGGTGRRETEALLDLLAGAGALHDAGTDPLLGLDEQARASLEPDLASLSLLHPAAEGATAALKWRRAASVRVVGAGRVGAQVALLLGAAGVGRVAVDDPEDTGGADLAPGGLRPRDLGRARADAVQDRLPPHARMTSDQPPALVVLAPTGAGRPDAAELVRAGTPHLLVAVRETTAVVGPLVLPGLTCCLGCLDHHRAERDPAWPVVAAQLDRRGRAGPGGRAGTDACDVALAGLAAALAALQALAWLDAPVCGPPPATAGGTLELALPDWRVRRRSWAVHPSCSCWQP